MSDIKYLDHSMVQEMKVTTTPRNPSVSGYGSKIPIGYMLKVNKRWHRVYVMQYSNSGSAYVLIQGDVHFLDIGTEHALQELTEKGE